MVAGLIVVVGVVGFLLFRPDTYFFDVAADEDLEEAFTTTVPDQTSGSSTVTNPPADTTSSPTATEVGSVSAGAFYGIDHGAEGTATVYESGGTYVLRFEDDTDIQNGPDLYVWVLPDDDYRGGSPAEYIDLGKLKGNVGGQNYELPSEFDPEVHRAVLIWCLRFAVPFAAAPLAGP
jgi:hypothetical protein